MPQNKIKLLFDKERGTSPILAISLAIILAAGMVAVTTVTFFRSGAYTTVKQIQIGSKMVSAIGEKDFDTKSPINAADIDAYAKTINQRIMSLDDYADFGPEGVSDSSLKLQ